MHMLRWTYATITIIIASVKPINSLQKGRQSQLDFLCNENNKYTVLPWDCTGYVQCSTDGVRWFAHWMECADHLYWSQTEKTCTMDASECANPIDVARKECPRYAPVTFPHPGSCAKFFDCSADNPPYRLRRYENECPYDQLYDVREERCKPRGQAYCGKNPRPTSRCDYTQECGPCEGRPDGVMALPDQPFSRNYLYCRLNKTYSPFWCPGGSQVFDPLTMKCSSVYKASIATYCTQNPTAKFTVATNCAKYYDCSKQTHHMQLDMYQSECPYRQLYDDITGSCKPYDEVDCGPRWVPKSPCEYKVRRCLTSGDGCIPCDADCKHLVDGFHDYTATVELLGDYLECRDGRTISVRQCPAGFTFSYNDCVDRAGKTSEFSPTYLSNPSPLSSPWDLPSFQDVNDKVPVGTLLAQKDGTFSYVNDQMSNTGNTIGSGTLTGGTNPGGTSTGGSNPSGTSTGGSIESGTSTGGSDTSGTLTGGTSPSGTSTGGSDTSGTSTGGSDTSSTATGGSDTSGTSTGGSDTTGTSTGSSDTTGTSTGGSDTSGTSTGGSDTSSTSTGGSNPSGTSTGGSDTSSTSTGSGSTSGTTTGGSDTSGTSTGGSDTSGTSTGGSDTSDTSTGGSDTTGTSTGGSDTSGTATGGSDTSGTSTGGSDTTGTSTGGSDTSSTSTGGNNPSGTSTGGSDTSGTSTGSGSTSGTTTGGSDTSGTSTGGSDTSGTSTGGSDTNGTSTGGSDTTGTSTGGSNISGISTGGTDQSGTSTGGSDTSSTSTGGSDTSGTSSGGSDPSGTSTGGSDTSSTTTGGSDTSSTTTGSGNTSGTSIGGSDASSTTTGSGNTSGTSTGGTSPSGTSTGGSDTTGTSTGGSDTTGTSTGGSDTSSTSTGGSNPSGTSTGGSDTSGTTTGGSDTSNSTTGSGNTSGTWTGGSDTTGTSTGGSDQSGTSTGGSDASGTPTGGSDASGTSTGGSDTSSTSTGGSNPSGTSTGGSDTSGTSTGGSDTSGTSTGSSDTNGTSTGGSNISGISTGGTDQSGTSTGGSDTSSTTTGGSDTSSTTTGSGNTSGTSTGGSDTSGTPNGGSDASGTSTGGSDASSTTTGGSDTSSTTTGSGNTSGTPTGGSDTTGTSTGGSDTSGTSTGGSDTSGTSTGGSDTSGTSTRGSDTSGTSTGSSDTTGTSTGGNDATGTSTNGSDTSGTSTGGSNPSGTSTGGSDTSSTTTGGSDTTGTSTSGSDRSGTSTGGSDTSGTSTGGSDTSGTSTGGSDTSGTSTGGSDRSGTSTGGSDTSSTMTGGSDTSSTTTGSGNTSGTSTGVSDTSGTSTGGSDTTGTSTGGSDTTGTSTGGSDTSGTATGGSDTSGTSVGGSDTSGTSAGGTDTTGSSTGGSDTSGTSTGGSNPSGTSTRGSDTISTTTGSSSTSGTSTGGSDTSGTTTGGSDTSGTSTGGSDTSGTSTGGSDTSGSSTSGTDPSGTSTGGSDTSGSSTGVSTPSGTSTGGSDTSGTSTCTCPDTSTKATTAKTTSATTEQTTQSTAATTPLASTTSITEQTTAQTTTTLITTSAATTTTAITTTTTTTEQATTPLPTTTKETVTTPMTTQYTSTTVSTTTTPTTTQPTPCTTLAALEPVIQYYCNCTDEVDVALDKIAILEDFMAEQKQINALAALECKNPPTLARASIELQHKHFGSEAVYTCDPGFSFCGSRAISSCPGNGMWEQIDGACVQSVWNYPRVMFRQNFLCPFAEGTVITVYGTPTRYRKSMIDLISGADKALLITICFQCGTTRNKVIFSAEEGRVGKNTVVWEYFPFKVGKEFKVVISVTQRAYKIEIADKPAFSFEHVLPVPTVDALVIADEITIRKVTIEPSNSLQSFMPELSLGVVPHQSIEVKDAMFITFKVKSCGNVHFKLATADSVTSQSYLVYLGEDGNTMSTIRKCQTCANMTVTWHQPLKCSEFTPFWASWSGGNIKIGAGYIPGVKPFLEVSDSEYPINYFLTGQTEASSAEWIFTTPIHKCGLPPPMTDSSVYVRENGLVGEAVYTCNLMFTFCGESHISRCSETGTWEGLKGECLLSTWHRRPMPASMPFPCSFGLGSVFSVYGRPIRPTKFSISLRSGADTLLIVTVGFNLGGMTNTVVYNANLDQIWGVQDESTLFPFQLMREFHLTITVEQQYFKIAVDGTPIHNFVHRAPFASINSAYINDDIMIRKIQVYPSEVAAVNCQPPTPLPNGNVYTIDTSVGSEVKHTCNTDFFFCGLGNSIVCDNTGKWEGLDGFCTLGTWYNIGPVPDMGFVQQFPCRYQPGLQVRVTGKLILDVKSGPFFSMQLRDGNEITLGIDVYKTEIKMNSVIPTPGKEETATIQPLDVRASVNFAIMMTEYEFVIYSGYDELHRYNHRTPVARAHEIIILPNLDVTQLQFTVES
ncbi:serine-rich adhesin for platelets-like [Haliotis asinina]|uniref:serine-rich adhesin for platelets-like n=1 Tax=Haliotis asinina TaxID=109174 RepID=UPI00353200AB